MNDPIIACVIVTYNRKALLKRCLEAVVAQTYKPQRVYIIDNASIDGTLDAIVEWGYKDTEVGGIYFEYLLMPRNEGGAGGFYAGMRHANETGLFDGVWVMDDDGIPDHNCLKELVSCFDKYDYVAPLVVSIEDETQTAFNGFCVTDFVKKANKGIIDNYANPFNGILYSKRLMDAIGYPKRELFIWGDEVNYDERASHAGFKPVCVIKAIHRHPVDRQETFTLASGNKIRVTTVKWKLYCLIRNSVYTYRYFNGYGYSIKHTFGVFVRYLEYSVKHKKDYSLALLCLKATYDGYWGIWGNHRHYMRKI